MSIYSSHALQALFEGIPAVDDARLLGMVMEHVSDGVAVLVPTKGGDFRFMEANPALARLLRQGPVGRSIRHVLPKANHRRLSVQLRRVARSLQPVSFKTTLASPAGEQHLKVKLLPIASGSKLESVVAVVKVTTETVRMQQQNETLKARFAAAFEYAPYGVCFMAADRRALTANRALLRMMGRPALHVQQGNFDDFIHPDDRTVFAQAVNKVFSGNRAYDGMELRLTPTGQDEGLWVSVSLSLAHNSDSPYVIAQFVDISGRKKTEAELLRMATLDHLTGVSNRLVFDRAIRTAIANAKRYKRKGAVLFIDMDQFKAINDNYGHKAGDQALQLVASTLQTHLRSTDTIARLGGDEFAAILEEADETQAHQKAEDIRRAITALRFTTHGKTVNVQASVGVKVFDGTCPTCDLETILNAADAAMYAQKKAGR